MLNPDTAPYNFVFARSAEAAASKLATEVTAVPVHQPAEIEKAMMALGPGGLILPPDGFAVIHRNLIVDLATRHRLPAIYWDRIFSFAGGLVSYGINATEVYRNAAAYVDRVLRGEQPADLPVQQPTKFELVINLKTAKALGLTISETLLATADEVIQ
jgi:putative ABC transport system substrate-binding protein